MGDVTLPAAPVAYVFPGQGSQFVGMGQALYDSSPVARATIEQADSTLGFPLSELMFNGPADELEDTINAQPAILTTSVAALNAVNAQLLTRGQSMQVSFTAGHSLGEFSALVAAGSLPFEAALMLVRERGRVMKAAGEVTPGGMAAVIGLDDPAIDSVCAEASQFGIVIPANRNCPGQVVISGEVTALEAAMELAKAKGAKLVKRLNVSIASHSPLMVTANAEFNRLVNTTPLADPVSAVVANVSALPLRSEVAIRQEIALQMERPVDWTGTVRNIIATGTTTFIEFGPGTVLSGLIKRIDRDATTISIDQLGLDLPSN